MYFSGAKNALWPTEAKEMHEKKEEDRRYTQMVKEPESSIHTYTRVKTTIMLFDFLTYSQQGNDL